MGLKYEAISSFFYEKGVGVILIKLELLSMKVYCDIYWIDQLNPSVNPPVNYWPLNFLNDLIPNNIGIIAAWRWANNKIEKNKINSQTQFIWNLKTKPF